jgi:dihydropteroate synthase-like protein
VEHPRELIHFVTGRLAEPSLRKILATLAPKVGFDYTVDVLNVTVAALLTTKLVARRMQVPAGTTRVVLPGLVSGPLEEVQAVAGVPVERGPVDLRQLDVFFGQQAADRVDYGRYDIEILAEINHAPRLSRQQIVTESLRLAHDGANLIDLGADPEGGWREVGDVVRALRDVGLRVSIDSFDASEVLAATQAGAELVLSVNSTNAERAVDWGVEVVVVPDVPATLAGFDDTVQRLMRDGVRHRLDPVLEPIGFGFAASLGRYLDVRRRYPEAEMMMGTGNLTELTDVDSSGVNVMLLGFCQELGIRSVLTTEVIHWARSSVRECDLARRLVHYAVTHRTLPKHVEPGLVTLRGGKPQVYGEETLRQLAESIRDPNFRVFAEGEQVHLVGAGLHLASRDPFALFAQLAVAGRTDVDPSHAFYLGYEMAKAVTALTLGKDYRQDQPLDWGHLTQAEAGHGPSHQAAEAARRRGFTADTEEPQ